MSRKHLVRSIVIPIVVVVALISSGCTVRTVTMPRSQIIEEAQDKGEQVASIEEDRAKFLAQERKNRDRLIALIENRLDGVPVDRNYRIGPGDELEIRVFDVEELNTVARVSQSGYIDLPLVSGIQATGLTSTELENEIRTRLRKYVRNPQARIFLTHFGSQEVAVVGAVEKPARYALRKGRNSLMEVLTLAGGLTDIAGGTINLVPVEFSGLTGLLSPEDRARFSLKTSGAVNAGQSNTKPNIPTDSSLEIPLQDIFGTNGSIPLEIPIRGGDMIIVPEAGKVLVEGEVATRGSFSLGKRSTLLGALAAAGGITYSAKIDEIEIVRPMQSGEQLRLVLNLEDLLSGVQSDIPIKNGDLVRVPSHSGRRLAEDTFNSISRIVNVGVGGSVNVVN